MLLNKNQLDIYHQKLGLIFNKMAGLVSKDLSSHLLKLNIIDSVTPADTSFRSIINISTLKYLHLSKGQYLCTGINEKHFYKSGLPLFVSRIHPKELELVLEALIIISNELESIPLKYLKNMAKF